MLCWSPTITFEVGPRTSKGNKAEWGWGMGHGLPWGPLVSLVEMIVETCNKAGNCSDGARECNAPQQLPSHDPENEAWHHNQAQNSDNEQRHPLPRVVEASGGRLNRALVSARGWLVSLFRVAGHRDERRTVGAGRRLRRALGFSGWGRGWGRGLIVDRLKLENDWLGNY